MPSRRPDVSHLLRRFADTDAGEARAADLAAVLTDQGIEATGFRTGEAEPGGPPGHRVYVAPAYSERAEAIAAAFEAEHDSALASRGMESARPTRAGCGLFWFFPLILMGMGALQLAGVGTGSAAIGVALVALGAVMIAASWWVTAQNRSDPDDVER